MIPELAAPIYHEALEDTVLSRTASSTANIEPETPAYETPRTIDSTDEEDNRSKERADLDAICHFHTFSNEQISTTLSSSSATTSTTAAAASIYEHFDSPPGTPAVKV